MHHQHAGAGRAELADELATVEAELRKTEDAIERYLIAFETGTMPEARCGERVRALGDRAAELRQHQRDLTATHAAMPEQPVITEGDVADLRRKINGAIENGDVATRKALVQELVEAVVVNGRDDIQPYFRLPGVNSDHAPQVREVSGWVPPAGVGTDLRTMTRLSATLALPHSLRRQERRAMRSRRGPQSHPRCGDGFKRHRRWTR